MQVPHLLLLAGIALCILGAALLWAPWLVSWFGRLPGDIAYEGRNARFYFPIASLLLLNLFFLLAARFFSGGR